MIKHKFEKKMILINVSGEKVERIITPKVEVNYYLNEDDESENLLR